MPSGRRRVYGADDFAIRRSTIPGIGRGLFARQRILSGDTVGWYTGKVIDDRLAETEPYVDSNYLFWVCRDHWIVADAETGAYTRFINHSDEPNTRFVVSTRWKTVRIEAVRRIPAGDEVFIDYGPYFWAMSAERKR